MWEYYIRYPRRMEKENDTVVNVDITLNRIAKALEKANEINLARALYEYTGNSDELEQLIKKEE